MADPLIDLATVPPIPLHPAVLAARQPLARSRGRPARRRGRVARRPMAMAGDRPGGCRAALRAVPDPRAPRGGDRRDRGRPRGRAADRSARRCRRSAAMAAARWELRGALAPLDEDAWDADPGGGEWTIRQTFGHIVNGQRSYGWYNAWYLKEGVVGRRDGSAVGGRLPARADRRGGGGRLTVARPGAPRRRGRREHRGGGGPRRGSHGRQRPVGRAARDDRLPARALRLAHPRAHRAGRQDARDAGPPAIRGRAARAAHPGDVRAARGSAHRTATGRAGAPVRDRSERGGRVWPPR